jgi:hypothetical protein
VGGEDVHGLIDESSPSIPRGFVRNLDFDQSANRRHEQVEGGLACNVCGSGKLSRRVEHPQRKIDVVW